MTTPRNLEMKFSLQREGKEEINPEAIDQLNTDNYDIRALERRQQKCTRGCMRCSRCISEIYTEINQFVYQIGETLGITLVFPVLRAGGHVIKRTIDGVVGIPLFAAAMAAEALPINTTGGLGIPFLGPLARIDEFFMLINDAWNPRLTSEEQRKRPLAAMTGLIMGIIAVISFMSRVHQILFDNKEKPFQWNPLEIAENLLTGDSSKLRSFIFIFSVYSAVFTAGYIGGKSVILEDFSSWLRNIKLNITKDTIARHLKQLHAFDKKVAGDAHQNYELIRSSIQCDWREVFGRSLEGLLKMAGAVGTFYDSAHRVTTPKAWLKHNGQIKRVGGYARVRINSCFNGFFKTIENPELKKEYPAYQALLQRKETEFETVLLYRGLWKKDKKTPYQRKIDHLLKKRLMENMARFKMGSPLLPPVLPSKFVPATNLGWEDLASKNTFISTLLTRTAYEEGIHIEDVALKMNEALYYCMTGQTDKLEVMLIPTPRSVFASR